MDDHKGFNMDDFLKDLQNGEIRIDDSAEVLASVFKELDKKKKKRRFFFLFFLGTGLACAGILVLILTFLYTGQQHHSPGSSMITYPACAYNKKNSYTISAIKTYPPANTGTQPVADLILNETSQDYTDPEGTHKNNDAYKHAASNPGVKNSYDKNKKKGTDEGLPDAYVKNNPSEKTSQKDGLHDLHNNNGNNNNIDKEGNGGTATNRQTFTNPGTKEKGQEGSGVKVAGTVTTDQSLDKDTGLVLSGLGPVPVYTNTKPLLSFSPLQTRPPAKEKKTRFSIGIVSSLLFSNFNVDVIKEPGDSMGAPPYNHYYKEKIEKENTWNTGMDVGISFRVMRKKFLFETGFRYARQMFYQDFTQFGNLFPSPGTNILYTSRLDYFELPIMAGGNFTFHRFSFKPVGGFHIGLMKREGSYQLKQFSELLIYTEYEQPTFTLNFYVKAELSYRFHRNFSAGISPVFLYNIIPAEQQPGIYTMRSWSLGVQGGIFYHF